jgi:hypothetical protein
MMRAISLFAAVATMAIATSASGQTMPPPSVYAAPVQPIAQQPPPVQVARLYVYEQESKSQLGALALEWFMPGVGSIYAGNTSGALKTWAMFLAGGVALAIGLERSNHGQEDGVTQSMMFGGVGCILAGRVFGLVDAWTSAGEHNDALRVSMGLVSYVSFGVTPLRVGDERGWGPTAQLRF